MKNMYRIQLVFIELPFEPYSHFGEDIVMSIREKVNNQEILLPIIPTKEMQIDLSTFEEAFKFNEKEMEAIEDCNSIYNIDSLIITSGNVEIWIS